MSALDLAVIALFVTALFLAEKASMALIRDKQLPREHKVLRLLVAWCVPIVGPTIVLRLQRGRRTRSVRQGPPA